MQARYYHPATGRFLSEDPAFVELPADKFSTLLADPQQWNSYAYGRNNPLTYRDPDGNWSLQQVDYAVTRFEAGQRFVGDLLTLGAYSFTVDMIESAATQFSQMPSFSNGAALVGSVPAGVALTVSGAFLTGVTLGEVSLLKSGTITRDGAFNSRVKGGHTLEPGPYAGESISARSSARNFTRQETERVTQIGHGSGCHTCGTKNPGTISGDFVKDHQPVSSLNFDHQLQRLFPQCVSCSQQQGGAANALKQLISKLKL